ncbi:hypothetical protein [Nocardia huaxiensis]|uniref:hypothetical protein n=1 Tax=Nocardia huaxiensis TaxID=2755382 RepID=UPI001E4BCF9E|nr:hypothetical protein [Nocardia huaxiensis]UFS99578.1 hypothetical protein LPY97_17665 [Nocardia huaxiensis]
MVTSTRPEPKPTRGPWFGEISFLGAAVGICVNVLVTLLVPLLIVFVVALYLIELLAVPVLWAVGGQARQVGTGIAVSLLAALVTGGGLVVWWSS